VKKSKVPDLVPVEQEADVVLAAHGLELAAATQLLDERERVDDLAALGDGDHRAEDAAVALAVEHRVVDVLGGAQ
jgi:hypothetical protein